MAKSSDEIKELQRSINRLQRSDGTVLHLGGRAYLVQTETVVDPDLLLPLLLRESVSEAEALDGLAKGCRLESPARPIDGRWLGSLQRDLKILEQHPDLAGLTRQAPRLFRGEVIGRGWLAARRAQLDRLQAACSRGPQEAGVRWEAALVLARCLHGESVSVELERIRERSTRLSSERRRETQERIDRLVARLEGEPEPAGEEPELGSFLDEAARQLRQAEQRPGRARRKRLRQIVTAVIAWPGDDPGALSEGEPDIDSTDSLVQEVRRLAGWRISQQGSTRSPAFQDRLVLCLSRYGLVFPPGPESGALRLDEPLLDLALRGWKVICEELAGLDLRLEQVLDLLALPVQSDDHPRLSPRALRTLGGWMVEGLEFSVIRDALRMGLLKDLVHQGWDVATARAYCHWVKKLFPHYLLQGMTPTLTIEAFERLRTAKHEELAVLAHCLLSRQDPGVGGPSSRQIALLDSTFALFQKLPEKARRCLEGLESVPAGLATTLCPDLAAWLEDDPDLDRYLHLCGLLGLPQVPSKNLLRDFELVARREAELDFLASLAEPGEAQRRRIAQLSKAAPPPGPGWTKRRLAERNEALVLQLLERRVDQALAEVLGRAFGLSLPRITPAWRDVFRFFLSIDENRELLGLLLRNATAASGRYFPPSLPANREWARKVAGRMDVEGWLRPRRRSLDLDGRRFVLEVEPDPVEVLRMGVPFDTCLSLVDGSNAASTVLNALDVNKRVLYLRDAAGSPVARQLIAVSSDLTFLRYRLYSAQDVPGMDQAFQDLCEEIAREAGLPLGDQGEPEKLHDGFWYDDGVRSFAEAPSASVEEYCRRFLGQPVPPEPDRGLAEEAELWEAVCAGDARRFATAGRLWSSSHLQEELAARLVQKLGIGKLTRLFRSGVRNLLPVLLWHWKEQGAEVLLRSVRRLGLSSREAEKVGEILWAMPMSSAAVKELAGLAVDLLASTSPADEHGIEHGSMSFLQRAAGAMKLEPLLDACDRLAPVWEHVVEKEPGCAECREGAESVVLAKAEEVFLRDSDTRLVVACLKARRRSDLSRRIALRILGRFPFPRQMAESLRVSAIQAPEPPLADAPWVRKALREVASRSPALARSPEMLAACLRQGMSVDLGTWPVPAEPPFQVLGDLILHVPELMPWLAPQLSDSEEIDESFNPWALSVYRKAEHAKGDRKKPMNAVDAERMLQTRQVLWRERGELADAEACSHPELARALEILYAANFPADRWVWWLSELTGNFPENAPGPLLRDAIAKGLQAHSRSLARLLPPDLVLWLWSFPPFRKPLLEILAQVKMDFEIGRFYCALREEARARSLDPRELLEGWVLALLRGGSSGEMVDAGDWEFLLLVIRMTLAHTGPKDWLWLYDALNDHLAATLFLRELEQVPARQRDELRGLLEPPEDDWKKTARFWLEQALLLPGGEALRALEVD